jgi:very-short-patch-repair endonuclease
MSHKILRGTTPKRWKILKPRAKSMRRDPTEAEALLWERLRGNKLGAKFRQQHVLDRFVADFFCFRANLIVEVDGPVHKERKDLDEARDELLRRLGYTILRFSNEEVLRNVTAVIAQISVELANLISPSPSGEGAGG